MLNYHFCGCDGDIIYSIDNIRLEFDLKYEKNFQLFCMKLDYFNLIEDDNFELKNYITAKKFAYKYLYTFINKLNDTSFSVGFCFNQGNKSNYKGFIDFNPNKVGSWKYLNMFLERCQICFKSQVIKRYDLAIDIPIDRSFVKLIKDKRSYHYLQDRSVTEYLGKRNNNNFVKVYDKKYESNLDYDLTRVEITIAPDEVMVYPQIQIKRFQNEMLTVELNSTEKVIYDLLCAVDEPFHYVQKLPQRKRAKFKELLNTCYKPFVFDVNLNDYLYNEIYRYYIMGDRNNDLSVNSISDDFGYNIKDNPFNV